MQFLLGFNGCLTFRSHIGSLPCHIVSLTSKRNYQTPDNMPQTTHRPSHRPSPYPVRHNHQHHSRSLRYPTNVQTNRLSRSRHSGNPTLRLSHSRSNQNSTEAMWLWRIPAKHLRGPGDNLQRQALCGGDDIRIPGVSSDHWLHSAPLYHDQFDCPWLRLHGHQHLDGM